MTRTPSCLAALTLMLGALAMPALAASSASSASSEASSASVGSISTSFEKSSNSSSKGKDVAEGDYRVTNVAQAEQRPGHLRVTLQALATPGAEGQVVLLLPQQAVERGAVAAGQIVAAHHRPYGIEFAKADTPFFLVLHDAWFDELSTRPLTL